MYVDHVVLVAWPPLAPPPPAPGLPLVLGPLSADNTCTPARSHPEPGSTDHVTAWLAGWMDGWMDVEMRVVWWALRGSSWCCVVTGSS